MHNLEDFRDKIAPHTSKPVFFGEQPKPEQPAYPRYFLAGACFFVAAGCLWTLAVYVLNFIFPFILNYYYEDITGTPVYHESRIAFIALIMLFAGPIIYSVHLKRTEIKRMLAWSVFFGILMGTTFAMFTGPSPVHAMVAPLVMTSCTFGTMGLICYFSPIVATGKYGELILVSIAVVIMAYSFVLLDLNAGSITATILMHFILIYFSFDQHRLKKLARTNNKSTLQLTMMAGVSMYSDIAFLGYPQAWVFRPSYTKGRSVFKMKMRRWMGPEDGA